MAQALIHLLIRNNYGPLAYDHTHILNLVYNWQLPSSSMETASACIFLLDSQTDGSYPATPRSRAARRCNPIWEAS